MLTPILFTHKWPSMISSLVDFMTSSHCSLILSLTFQSKWPTAWIISMISDFHPFSHIFHGIDKVLTFLFSRVMCVISPLTITPTTFLFEAIANFTCFRTPIVMYLDLSHSVSSYSLLFIKPPMWMPISSTKPNISFCISHNVPEVRMQFVVMSVLYLYLQECVVFNKSYVSHGINKKENFIIVPISSFVTILYYILFISVFICFFEMTRLLWSRKDEIKEKTCPK